MRKLLALIILASGLLVGYSAVAEAPATSNPNVIELTTKNTVNFRGVVTGDSTTAATLALAAAIKDRGSKKYPIYLVMDTPGGSVMAGLDFINFLESLKNVHTITIFAASMGSAIVEANPGTRYITKTGVLMFHRARGTFQGQFEDGEVEQQLVLWKSIVRGMEQTNADRMGLSLETYKENVRNEWWIYGPNTVALKAADKVVVLKCSDDLLEKRELATADMGFVQVRVKFSGCPLLRDPLEYLND